ncbi:multidrug resistance-associated ABC transporter [Irpex rosettiformis]|uniref:Multidrug resistance-associated ABC transporter n=1 Tax=Irpex rosettiformis TaxID=378272 RepID=A0ACB8TYR6_9APHY|nr:multidrug resistance-associated ABC transporter [Irpex rosettiformis]
MYNLWHPPPAPPGFGEGKTLPERNASILSRVLFTWLDSILRVGFSRPLQKEDLWELPHALLTESLCTELEHNFYASCPAEKRPRSYCEGDGAEESDTARPLRAATSDGGITEYSPPQDDSNVDAKDEKTVTQVIELNKTQGNREEKSDKSTPEKPFKEESALTGALFTTFRTQWYISGFLKLAADTLKTTTPLLNRRLLTWLTNSFVFYKAGPQAAALAGIDRPQGVGYGIGLAIALFAMQEVSSLMTNHFMQSSMIIGTSMRTSLIGAIFRKSLRLSGQSRNVHSVGKITTMISTDTTRLNDACQYLHNLWISPIQIIIAIGLLIGTLGYSALVGLGAFIFALPIQAILATIMYTQRKKMVTITDQRVRLTTEILQGIRLIKYYAWEGFYAGKITELRGRELQKVKNSTYALAALVGFVSVVPVVTTVLSFITYALSGHDLSVPIIFTSLQYFTILHQALVFLPFSLEGVSNGLVALQRIGPFLTAEELEESYTIDPESKYAIDVEGDFRWEVAGKLSTGEEASEKIESNADSKNSSGDTKKKEKKGKGKQEEPILPTATPADDSEKDNATQIAGTKEEKPFELTGLNLKVQQGEFVAIVGRVGSGKSSLLQALIGEMRKVKGNSVFSSSIAYVPQTSWIINATLRDNILFGREVDEEKLQGIIRSCCLEKDLEMLPNGQYTEIGEKGINLSGGQKARVSLARAAYSGADIVLMDDSLSAFDAHVGKAVLENCVLSGPLAGKTRVLVTHALHVLHLTDYIYVMDNGAVAEQGTYQDLMNDSVLFSRVMEEYGTREHGKKSDQASVEEALVENVKGNSEAESTEVDRLMQEEERLTGAVSGTVYYKYFQYAGGFSRIVIILILIGIFQTAQVANNLFLGFWTQQSLSGFTQGDYIGTYAALGAGVGIFAFIPALYICITGVNAGFSMFKASLSGVLHSSMAFFDTTPMGRVLSRLSKDQDTIDTEIAMVAFALLTIFSSVLGTAALVFYTFPLLGIIFAPLTIFYYLAATFYRRTSVETKRLDSLMRSALYSSYSETLTGLSTVRAYGEQSRFIHNTDHGLDLENRAYYITISIQRWLGVRLDLLGNILIFGIALFAAGFRKTVDPGKIGVVLSYSLSITQVVSELVSQYAINEQNFNAVERVLHYTELPPEGDLILPNDPSPSWPPKGEIKFDRVEMAYREGLPLVLKGVSFQVRPGEKVGIVGRTGAGKSSLLQALFRCVSLQSGKIYIDDQDIATVGLDTLRSRLALVPQDSVLFLGTLRDNLDPQASRTDAELIDALKKVGLLLAEGSSDSTAEAKFSLDAAVGDEGLNYSAGEKQLIALCRALIRNSRVIVLDEATSNVDAETDAKLQRTIQTEFASSTLLCIAHRLNTIVYYDRILVMDDGQVAEFDTPLNLFDDERSIFRSLCNEASLTREDIVRIRATVHSDHS